MSARVEGLSEMRGQGNVEEEDFAAAPNAKERKECGQREGTYYSKLVLCMRTRRSKAIICQRKFDRANKVNRAS